MWPPVPGLGVSAAAGRAAGVVDCRFAGVLNFQSKAAFSGAMAVGMAMQGGFDPEIPVQNGTRHRTLCRQVACWRLTYRNS
jgi:hypothetical protein